MVSIPFYERYVDIDNTTFFSIFVGILIVLEMNANPTILTVKNFGPIEDIRIEFNKYTILIGNTSVNFYRF